MASSTSGERSTAALMARPNSSTISLASSFSSIRRAMLSDRRTGGQPRERPSGGASVNFLTCLSTSPAPAEVNKAINLGVDAQVHLRLGGDEHAPARAAALEIAGQPHRVRVV